MNVEYLRHMGTDLDVVNNARVSFNKQKEVLDSSDEGIIRFLAEGVSKHQKNDLILQVHEAIQHSHNWIDDVWNIMQRYRDMPTHWAPFANGIRVTFRVTAPLPVFRQLDKHRVGYEDSEVSRRYITEDPTFYHPKWRQAAENVKQGSSERPWDSKVETWDSTLGERWEINMNSWYKTILDECSDWYSLAVKDGLCAEQARFVLPQSMETTKIVSHSLYGWARVYLARSDRDHAQREIADVVDQIAIKMRELYPLSWKYLCHE